MANTWFTSDWHLFHRNIIRHCNRPFKNTEEMHNTITERYNSAITEEDTVFILGDITLMRAHQFEPVAKILETLKGHKHLILGNHDALKPFKYHDFGFESVHTTLSIHLEGKRFHLVHDPAMLNIPNAYILHGHVHQHWNLLTSIHTGAVMINVGVDVNDFAPVSLDEILVLVNSYEERKKKAGGKCSANIVDVASSIQCLCEPPMPGSV